MMGHFLNETDMQCTYNVTLRRVRESLFPWKSNMSITYRSVCACVRVRACMWVRGRVGVCMRINACCFANPACNAYAPYCGVICGPSGSTKFFDVIS